MVNEYEQIGRYNAATGSISYSPGTVTPTPAAGSGASSPAGVIAPNVPGYIAPNLNLDCGYGYFYVIPGPGPISGCQRDTGITDAQIAAYNAKVEQERLDAIQAYEDDAAERAQKAVQDTLQAAEDALQADRDRASAESAALNYVPTAAPKSGIMPFALIAGVIILGLVVKKWLA